VANVNKALNVLSREHEQALNTGMDNFRNKAVCFPFLPFPLRFPSRLVIEEMKYLMERMYTGRCTGSRARIRSNIRFEKEE